MFELSPGISIKKGKEKTEHCWQSDNVPEVEVQLAACSPAGLPVRQDLLRDSASSANMCLWWNLSVWSFTLFWLCSRHVRPLLFFYVLYMYEVRGLKVFKVVKQEHYYHAVSRSVQNNALFLLLLLIACALKYFLAELICILWYIFWSGLCVVVCCSSATMLRGKYDVYDLSNVVGPGAPSRYLASVF